MTEKTLNLVIGVFIICVMLAPIKSFFSDFSMDIPEINIPDSISSDAQKAYNNAVISETESRLENSLFSMLSSEGFSVRSVNVSLGKNEDGGIYITGIDIYINKTERQLPKIIRRTEEEYSITPRVAVRQ